MNPNGAAGATWDGASEESCKSAEKHFFVFLIQHEFPRNEELKHKLYGDDGDSLTLDDNRASFDFLIQQQVAQHIKLETLDNFARYLAEHARNRRNLRDPLMYESASRYLSSSKEKLVRGLFTGDARSPLDNKAKLRKIRRGMMKLFIKRQREKREPLSNSHKPANREDLMLIIMLCYWNGDMKFGGFACFVLALYSFSARGHECSEMLFRELGMQTPVEFDQTGGASSDDAVFCAEFFRDKNFVHQMLHSFVDRDSLFMDWYFSLFYSMVMHNHAPSDSVFPEFKKGGAVNVDDDDNDSQINDDEEADGDDDDDDDDNDDDDEDELDDVTNAEEANNPAATHTEDTNARSNTRRRKKKPDGPSKAFNINLKNLHRMVEIFEEEAREEEAEGDDTEESQRHLKESYDYVAELCGVAVEDLFPNLGLTSHSPKRGSINTANRNPCVKSAWICISVGWIMKAVHTLFDYIDAGPATDMQVARAKANWNVTDMNNNLGGGRPPSLNALRVQTVGDSEVSAYDVAVDFSRKLFFTYGNVDGAKSPQLQQCLTASLLRHLRAFVRHLSMHPRRKFGTTNEECFRSNLFLRRVMAEFTLALQQTAQVNMPLDDKIGILLDWSDRVEANFAFRNFLFTPTSLLVKHLDSGDLTDEQEEMIRDVTTFDTRPLAAHLHQNQKLMFSLQQELHGVKSSFTRLDDKVRHQIVDRVSTLETKMDSLLATQATMAGMLQAQSTALQQLLLQRSTSAQPQIALGGDASSIAAEATTTPIEDACRQLQLASRTMVGDETTRRGATATATSPRAAAGTRRVRRITDTTSDAAELSIIPRCMRDVSLPDVFVAWHTKGYSKQPGGDDKGRKNKSAIGFCVGYLSLFLKEQVPALPPGKIPGDEGTRAWLTEVNRLANEAWSEFCRAWVHWKGASKSPPSRTTPFRTFMEVELGPDEWPPGPSVASQFGVPSRDYLLRQLTGKRNKRRRTMATEDEQTEE